MKAIALQNTMNNETFTSLMNVLQLDSDSEQDHIVLVAKYMNFEVSFYESEGKFLVEDFGFTNKNGWNQLEPTDTQIEIMKSKINAFRSQVISNDSELDIDTDFDGDYHNYYGTTPQMFV